MKNLSRKDFIKTTLVGGAALLGSGRIRAAVRPGRSPNGDIRVAVVGVNGKGNSDIRNFPRIPGVKVVALCDVDSTALARRVEQLDKENVKVTTYIDYRRLLEDSSVDAVVISTPNHWHSLMTIWACQAGKDAYVEKPVSHNVWEGRKAVEAARKYGRIVQSGTQFRSAEELHRAVAYVREGNLGKILWARGLCYKPREDIGRTSGPQPVPAGLDYDLWSGPAPLEPPRRNTPNGTVHYDWHWFWNHGGGDIANQGPHQMDICRWFLGQGGLPPAVMSIGGRFACDDDAETPNTQIALLDYKPAPLIFEVRGLPARTGMRAMSAYRGTRVGVVIQCEHGYFAAGSTGGGFMYDNDGKRIAEFTGAGGGEHRANFIAAMRSRKDSDLAAPIEGGHVSSALCHLANISYRLGAEMPNEAIRNAIASHEPMSDSFGRMLEHLQANDVDVARTPGIMGARLDLTAGAESFLTREKYDMGYWANTLLTRQYRKPYVVPEMV